MPALKALAFPVDVLDSVVAGVFEKMFFVETAAVPSSCPAEDLHWTRLDFDGADCGWCAVALSDGTGAALAADFLGVDFDEADHSSVLYLLQELANIVCGAFLSRWQPGSLFHLSSPEAFEGCARDAELLRCYRIREGVLHVALYHGCPTGSR